MPYDEQELYDTAEAHMYMVKLGGDASTAHAMAGQLYLSQSGWLLLDVPNAVVRGAFQALHEPGTQLPPSHNGALNAHITVMRPEEIESLGGADKITERGKQFHYTYGPLKTVVPDGWSEVSKCWFIEVSSPELKALRKSYGLTPLPKDNEHQFHITVAVRKKHVLKHNEVSKSAADAHAMPPKRYTIAVDLDGTICEYDGWKGEDHFGALRNGVAQAMQKLHDEGNHIIIWTCRGAADKVRTFLTNNKIPFDYINENPNQPEGNSAKINADVYIDDKSIDGRQEWPAILSQTNERLREGAQKVSPPPMVPEKEASVLLPATVGGMAADLIGLRAIMKDKARQVDPVDALLADESHLDALRGKRRKRLIAPPIINGVPGNMPVSPLDKLADYYKQRHRPSVHRPTPDGMG